MLPKQEPNVFCFFFFKHQMWVSNNLNPVISLFIVCDQEALVVVEAAQDLLAWLRMPRMSIPTVCVLLQTQPALTLCPGGDNTHTEIVTELISITLCAE